MAQKPHDSPTHPSPSARRTGLGVAGTGIPSANVSAVAARAGQKRPAATKGMTAAVGRQPGPLDGPIQLRPPVLLEMDEAREATAVALLAELIGARLAHGSADLIFEPANGLLDLRPAADASEPASPAA
jgi:hypothetical protein